MMMERKNGNKIHASQTDESDSDISYSVHENHDNNSDSDDSSVVVSQGGTDSVNDSQGGIGSVNGFQDNTNIISAGKDIKHPSTSDEMDNETNAVSPLSLLFRDRGYRDNYGSVEVPSKSSKRAQPLTPKGIAVNGIIDTEQPFQAEIPDIPIPDGVFLRQRQVTERFSNLTKLAEGCTDHSAELQSMFIPPSPKTKRNLTAQNNSCKRQHTSPKLSLSKSHLTHTSSEKPKITIESIPLTLIGSFTMGLYHIVVCLAQASAITRPQSSISILAPMARFGALGPLLTTPVYLSCLGGSFPVLYPALDIFIVPFLSQFAIIIDTALFEAGRGDEDDVFITTFCFLSGIGLILSGLFNILGKYFKLTQLGAFLPYNVLGGFFSTVGILFFTLAFSVDMGGLTLGSVLLSRDFDLMERSFIHHIPTLIAGGILYIVGSRYRMSMPILTASFILVAYLVIYLLGTNLEEARNEGWFWKAQDFSPRVKNKWFPPFPFGVLVGLFCGKVYFPAIIKGLPTAIAMSTIYLLRCTFHAPALLKNTKALAKWKEDQKKLLESSRLDETVERTESGDSNHFEITLEPLGDNKKNKTKDRTYKPPSVAQILTTYGQCLVLSGLAGGSACVPAFGPAGTLFKLGATGLAPQYGSTIILLIFYLTNFELVSYIPKAAFSAQLIVVGIEMIQSWFFMSYTRTANKTEWLVVPLIVIFAFTFGSIMSIFLGIALSTFVFVANFYRSGVVKFMANGLTIHSTVERNTSDGEWLDKNGDLIQLLVLQNYLFFGNASSCMNFVSSMFDEPDIPTKPKYALPPIPMYLIIDLTLVTGIDTSAVDVFADIILLCKSHKCQVLMTGISNDMRRILSSGGITATRKKTGTGDLRFLPDIDTALGETEDNLLKFVFKGEERARRDRFNSGIKYGLSYALYQIDLQHKVNFSCGLEELCTHTQVIDLAQNESLFHLDDGSIKEGMLCGIFFIEYGMMRIERNVSSGTTRVTHDSRSKMRELRASVYAVPFSFGESSIGHLQARSSTIGEECAFLKNSTNLRRERVDNVRLARIGPGWIIGTVEESHNLSDPAIHIAISDCRLHYLSLEKINELEINHPVLMLKLLKLLSLLSARRQEGTINQLANLHSVMTSIPPSKPINRTTMAVIKNLV